MIGILKRKSLEEWRQFLGTSLPGVVPGPWIHEIK